MVHLVQPSHVVPAPLRDVLHHLSNGIFHSADIVYMVTGGSSLHQFYILCGGTAPMGLSAWIVVFAATELISCQVGTLQICTVVAEGPCMIIYLLCGCCCIAVPVIS